MLSIPNTISITIRVNKEAHVSGSENHSITNHFAGLTILMYIPAKVRSFKNKNICRLKTSFQYARHIIKKQCLLFLAVLQFTLFRPRVSVLKLVYRTRRSKPSPTTRQRRWVIALLKAEYKESVQECDATLSNSIPKSGTKNPVTGIILFVTTTCFCITLSPILNYVFPGPDTRTAKTYKKIS
jgi:hypothetical protein